MKKKLTPQWAIDSEFFHRSLGNPCMTQNKSRSWQLAIRFLIGNYCTVQDGTVTLKGSYTMGGGGRIFLETSAPLPLINIYRISLISAGSISLDSTFKEKFPEFLPLHKQEIFWILLSK
jgi:hypothetical protein